MSGGTQVDLDWAGTDQPSTNDGFGRQGAEKAGSGAPSANAPGTAAAYLTDEEILGLEPSGVGAARNSSVIPSEARLPVGQARNLSSIEDAGNAETKRDSPGTDSPRNDSVQESEPVLAMPEWMRTAAADPKNGVEAQQLWREHQEFRAAFASPEEARAIKELLPGGVRDVLSLREATQSVERIDAALFSGNARAQAEVVAELARANPAAFRSLFSEAAKLLAGAGQGPANVSAEVQDRTVVNRETISSSLQAPASNLQNTSHPSQDLRTSQSPHFDPAAYSAFERATNDAVARDVRGSIGDTLARVMPEGVAEGAARRIGEDIFNEVHRALAADRALSEQVAGVLRDRRFGSIEQQSVAALLAGRAKQLVPSVARRVIGEWTSTVLNTARSKAARQAAAASRVDIAAPGGSLDSMPLRQMSAREVNYASMSDEEILGM